jgi:NAD(P)H-hydrate epimerase
MKKIVTPAEMQSIDRETIEHRGVPGEDLMERAGRAVFNKLIGLVPDVLNRSVRVICGKGNNGGDGFVVARHLRGHGVSSDVFVAGAESDIKGDAGRHYRLLADSGARVEFIDDVDDLPEAPPDVVVDALLGTGTRGKLDGLYLDLVRRMNAFKQDAGTLLMSIDIPSGLNGETGQADEAVLADHTVTMGLPKTGLLLGAGKKFVGHLHVVDIGFPPDLLDGGDLRWVEGEDVRWLFPPRRHDAHKYDFGRLLIVAGSKGMSGAAFLCARAAARSGAGMIKVAMPKSAVHVIEQRAPEVLSVALDETEAGSLTTRAAGSLQELVGWCDGLAIGPGLSRHPETIELVRDLIRELRKPAVVDADAVVALGGEATLIRSCNAPLIFTPHAGELAALSGMAREEIRRDRAGCTRRTACLLNKIVILKGSPTLVSDSAGITYVCSTGNPGMATGGSGDVLTGVIGAFMVQGLDAVQAAYAGAYVHGLAGDLARADKGERGLISSDLIEYLPKAFQHLRIL